MPDSPPDPLADALGETLDGRADASAPSIPVTVSPVTADWRGEDIGALTTLADDHASHPPRVGVEVTREDAGRYHNEEVELGRGGLGRVFVAFDAHLGRDVAVKELHEVAERGAQLSASTVRFLREARVTGQLEHPNIVPVYELGQRPDGTLYYTMKVVRGRTLTEALASAGTLNARLELLTHYLDLCQAIAYAHSRDVVHRDIKPDNVMIGDHGETVVLDWGLAKARRQRELSLDVVATPALAELDSQLTRAGALLGTPAYMSPEQAAGRIDLIDARSDVFSLGVVLYELLTGSRPFEGNTPLQVAMRVATTSAPSPSQRCPEAPPDLVAVCDKALSRERSARYPSAQELAKEIEAFLTGGRVQAHAYTFAELLRRFVARHRIAVAIGAIAVLLLGVLAALSASQVMHERDHAVTAREAALAAQKTATARGAQVLFEAAEGSLEAGAFLKARAQLRQSLEVIDSVNTRALWGRLQRAPERWIAHTRCQGVQLRFDDVGGEVDVLCRRGGGVRLDVRTGEVRDQREGSEENMRFGALSRDGSRQAIIKKEGSVEIWDPRAQRRLVSLAVRGPRITRMDFSQAADLLAISTGDEIELWDVETGRYLAGFRGHGEGLTLAFSPDGSRLATGHTDHSVRLWSLEDMTEVAVFEGHEGLPLSLAFSPDGERLASTGVDRTIRLWDVVKGAPIGVLYGHREAGYALAFHPSGRLLASGSRDMTVRLWDVERSVEIATLEGHTNFVDTLGFNAGGTLLASAGYDWSVRLWDVERATRMRRQEQHTNLLNAVAFDHSGSIVASAAYDGRVLIRDAETGALLDHIKEHSSAIRALRFSPTEPLAASGGEGGLIRLWDPRSRATIGYLAGHTRYVKNIDISADGSALVSASIDGTVRVWDLEGRTQRQVIDDIGIQPQVVVFRPGYEQIAVATGERTALLYDLTARRVVSRFSHQGQPLDGVVSVDFNHDGSRIAIKTYGGDIFIESLEGDEAFTPIKTTAHAAARFHPSRDLLAVQRPEGHVALHDLESGRIRLLLGHESGASNLAFSQDGRTLVAVGADQSVRTWDVESGESRWRASGIIDDPATGEPVILTQLGWRQLVGGGSVMWPPHLAWVGAVERAALSDASGGHLCLITQEGEVERWRLAIDQRVAETRVEVFSAIHAIEGGCVIRSRQRVQKWTSSGLDLITDAALAVGVDGDDGGLWIVTSEALISDDATRHEGDFSEVVAIEGSRRVWRLLESGGRLRQISRDSGREARAVTLGLFPRSPPTVIHAGPRRTIFVGFADGAVGLWSLETGRRLDRIVLHGAVQRFSLRDRKLHIVTRTGDVFTWPLEALYKTHRELLQEVRREVPFSWVRGGVFLDDAR